MTASYDAAISYPFLDAGLPSFAPGAADGHSGEPGSPVSVERRGGLTRRDFFAEVVARLREDLPEDRRAFGHRSNPLLLKVDFGNPRVHYEVWCDGERHILGLGLHFEDGPVSTAAYLAYFDDRIVELKHQLGPVLELERWTATWGHLYEHWPLGTLTAGLAMRVASRLAQLIETLQPLVEEAAVPPERSALAAAGAESERSGRWRKWRR